MFGINTGVKNRDDRVGRSGSVIPGLGCLDFLQVPFVAWDHVGIVWKECGPGDAVAFGKFNLGIISQRVQHCFRLVLWYVKDMHINVLQRFAVSGRMKHQSFGKISVGKACSWLYENLARNKSWRRCFSAETNANQHRSEERRVGKERRSRWSPYH